MNEKLTEIAYVQTQVSLRRLKKTSGTSKHNTLLNKLSEK